MAKRYNSVLGIDIGSQNIKVAEIKLQGRTPTVTAWGIAQTPEGAADHIAVHEPEQIAVTIRQLCTAIGASVADVVVTLSGQGSVLVRTLEVPVMSDAELKQHMDWEVTRNIPFAESTVYSDFKPYPPDPQTPQNMDVVMAIATQSSINAMLGMVKKAGRRPIAFDVEPLGLGRALDTCYSQELGTQRVCVIDIGHKATAINIYRDAQLVMPRWVPIGGEMFTRAIADGIGVTFEEAQYLKHNKAELSASMANANSFSNPFENDFGATTSIAAPGTGAATQAFNPYNPFGDLDAAAPAESDPTVMPMAATGGEVTEMGLPMESIPGTPPMAPVPVAPAQDPEVARIAAAISPVVDEFVAEVRRSVDYYRSKGGDVDAILLAGGGAKLKGLPEYLEAALGIRCTIFDPFHSISFSSKKSDEMLLNEHRPDFAMAVGTALHICY